jgi:hypothetical protein
MPAATRIDGTHRAISIEGAILGTLEAELEVFEGNNLYDNVDRSPLAGIDAAT